MKIKTISVPVLDQEKAAAFYTEKLAVFNDTCGNRIQIVEML